MPQSDSTTEALNTLREKLRDMFHFAHNDLDFGLFRILKIKRDEINQFIDEKLPTIVNKVLAEIAKTLYDSQLTQVKEYVTEEGSRRQLAGVTQLDVNADANQNALLEGTGLRRVHLITTSDFDSGSAWDTAEA